MPIVDPLSELIPIVNPLFELIALALQAMSRVVHIRSHHAPRDAPPHSSNVVITLRVMHRPIHHSENAGDECLLNPKRIKRPKLRRKGVVANLITRQFRRRCLYDLAWHSDDKFVLRLVVGLLNGLLNNRCRR